MLKRYDQVLMPEINLGQMRLLHPRAVTWSMSIGLNKVAGQAVHDRARSRAKIAELVG